MIELQRDALIDAYYTLLERFRAAEADLAASREREQRLTEVERTARAYDDFVLRYGVFRIRNEAPLSAQMHTLHKDMHDALAAAAPAAEAQETRGEGSVHGIGCPIAQTSDPTTCICDDDEWGPDNAAQELERGPR